MRRRHRLVVVDDSAVTRKLLVTLLDQSGEFDVVAAVGHGERAVERVAVLRPDAVTMDLHLPGIDGLEATRRIMRLAPTPILVVSASSNLNDEMIFQALQAGAVGAIKRPMPPGHPSFQQRRRRLLDELRTIVQAQLKPGATSTLPASVEPTPTVLPGRRIVPIEVIAIGASTGGPAALHRLLLDLPAEGLPPVLVVQHITEGFVEGLASWLASSTGRNVRLAANGDPLAPATVFLAPDGRHLAVDPSHRIVLRSTAPVGRHRPSATVLFEAVAEVFGPAAIGITLTGMGRDGAEGLLRLREAGGVTLAQDDASSVVYGMAGAAVEIGAVDSIVPLARLGAAVRELLGW